MRPLMQEIEQLDREELRLKRWRRRNRPRCRKVAKVEEKTSRVVCDRCGRESCGAAEYAVVSDVLAMRVGFRCAVEAWLLREEFPTAVGQIDIDVVQ
jgi:hypothetical protein